MSMCHTPSWYRRTIEGIPGVVRGRMPQRPLILQVPRLNLSRLFLMIKRFESAFLNQGTRSKVLIEGAVDGSSYELLG